MNFLEFEIKDRYRTSDSDNIGKDFIAKLLNCSTLYERAVGFFSSSSLIYTSKGLSHIASKYVKGNPPVIRFIVSPRLVEADVEAIKRGYKSKKSIIEESMLREFSNHSDEFEMERLNMLSNLISIGAMDIKVAVTEFSENSIGMYHEKIGVFKDEVGNTLSFTGSLNESENAFSNNFESVTLFKSWNGTNDICSQIESDFEKLWNNETNRVEIYSFPKAIVNKLFKYQKSNYNANIDEDEEIAKLSNQSNLPHIDYGKMPTFPYDYQKVAINNWFKNRCCGIFDMATGTGKTYTAYGAMVRLLDVLNYKLATIIICPYQHLVEQWVADAANFHIKDMVIGYSNKKYSNYHSELKKLIQDYNDGIVPFFYFITTNASYKTTNVQNLINLIEKPVLFVADEAHNLGTERMKACLNTNFQYRLALSATIDRYRDEEGTKIIYDYFGEKCIEYTLQKAIDEEKLTKYYYHPILVYLTNDEREQYLELTKQLSKSMVHGKDGKLSMSKYAKLIAIKRARLIAGASGKYIALKDEMKNHFDENYILVYCGTSIIDTDSSEEIKQVDRICQILGNELKMKVGRYTSRESVEERELIKERFKCGNDLQALVAIKCLDEGVNIPSIRKAFILASSTNPREYIQRRGRVLRLADNKDFATIYDFVCLPLEFKELAYVKAEEVKIYKSILTNEINRIQEFGKSSINFSESDSLIESIKEKYGLYNLELDELSQINWEEGEDYEQ